MNVPTTLPFVSKVVSSYNKATQGLQNYGANVAKMNQGSTRDSSGKVTSNYYGMAKLPNPFKASSYQKP